MTTIAEARAEVVRRLRASGVEAADAEASALLEALTGLSRSEQVLLRALPLDEARRARLEEVLSRREQREPLQLVLGVATFYGVQLAVRPGVLIPRPETERLVELALGSAPPPGDAPWRVLDVGCGGGAVALALAAERADATIVACDVDPRAVALARENAVPFGARLRVVESDLLAHPEVRAAASEADLLVANLPYLPDGDRHSLPPEVGWDPERALFGGPDGLALARRLLGQVRRVARPGARVWLELDGRNARALRAEAAAAGWPVGPLEHDLTGRPRFLALRVPRREAAAPARRAAGDAAR
jgi:release factor glutamine methyltransferase